MDNSARLAALGFKEQLALAQLEALAQLGLERLEQLVRLAERFLLKLTLILPQQTLGQNQ
jgi:hypothetical protein